MKEYGKILNKDEKIVWERKPQFLPFFAKSFLIVPFGLFFLGFSLFWVISAFTATATGSTPFPANLFPLFGVPFILVGLGISLTPVYTLLVYRNVFYAITDKRVILEGGFIGRDFEVVDFDKIQNSQVNVGIFDKLFGQNSGSIAIDAGRVVAMKNGSESRPHTLNSITDPYKTFELLKKVSYDIKSDLEYPNALRPDVNPGYTTKYQIDKK